MQTHLLMQEMDLKRNNVSVAKTRSFVCCVCVCVCVCGVFVLCTVCIGGAMMFTFYRALGLDTGNSLVEVRRPHRAPHTVSCLDASPCYFNDQHHTKNKNKHK